MSLDKDVAKKYCQYIKNTDQEPLAVEAFDDDWEPAGSLIRRQLREGNFIQEKAGNKGIVLTQKGKALL